MSRPAPRRSRDRAAESARARIAGLVARFNLPSCAEMQLAALLELVVAEPDAPTTLRDPGAVLRGHLADSLVALELVELRNAAAIADLGSGAGFPGLPIAVALPDAQLHLVESNNRKCEFIARAIAAAEVSNATVIPSRAESWVPPAGGLDVVTTRALAPLAVVAEYAAPLLRLGGTLVAWRGRRDLDAEAAAARAGAELGLELRPALQVRPFPNAEHRYLHLMSKVRNTPSRFPRRPGVAIKRPLGGI